MNAVLPWLKKNWLFVLCIIIAIATLTVGPIFGGKLKKQLIAETEQAVGEDYNALNRARVNYSVPDLSDPNTMVIDESLPVHEDRTEHFKALREAVQGEAERIWDMTLERNRAGHEVLVEGLFPEPSREDEQFLPGEFARRYITEAHVALLAGIDAGGPPDPQKLEMRVANYAQTRTEQIMETLGPAPGDGRSNQPEIPEEEQEKLTEELRGMRIGTYRQAASEIDIYATPDVFKAVLSEVPEKNPSLDECWDWQSQLWIHQDLLAAIKKANDDRTGIGSDLRGVPASVVKRILGIEVDAKGPGYEPPEDEESGGGGLMPPSEGLISVVHDASMTGRVSGPYTDNGFYDLRSATLDLLVSSKRLPLLFDAISQTNFMTVLECDLQTIMPMRDLRYGYYYGDEHVIRAIIRVETIWLRDWTKDYMPPRLRQALGIPDDVDEFDPDE